MPPVVDVNSYHDGDDIKASAISPKVAEGQAPKVPFFTELTFAESEKRSAKSLVLKSEAESEVESDSDLPLLTSQFLRIYRISREAISTINAFHEVPENYLLKTELKNGSINRPCMDR